MAVQRVFVRSEIKYLITAAQRELIEKEMAPYMKADEFGRSTICSVYYDTPDYMLIRRSLDSPVYKEKLRLRSYGRAAPGSTVYAEIKKKYDSIVYKRRVGMELAFAENYLAGGWRNADEPSDQIGRELMFALKRYGDLRPAAFVSGEREAFYAVDDHEFRVTFDENILGRDYDLSLDSRPGGLPLLEPDQVLMEIKAGGAYPLWMCRLLSREKIYKTSFSKYGNIYNRLIRPNEKIYNGVNTNAKPVQWIV